VSQTAESNDAAIEVPAFQLFAEYDGNEIAADENYKGKILIVNGMVKDIGNDITGSMYVTLDSGNPIMSVQCFFSDKHRKELASMQAGMRVRIRGKCDGKFGNIFIRGCQIEE